MKAAVINKWGNENVFELTVAPKPQPNNEQVLIRVHASSVNPVDYKQRNGNHRFILGSPFPIILGYDVSGEVIEVGSLVTQFKPGDIVFGDLDNKYGGALAEYAVGHEHCFALKPTNLDYVQSAAIPLAGLTALQALRSKGGLQSGQTVIINGATGGVGHLAVQIAKALDARVIAVASKKNIDLLQKYSPDRTIDYTSENLLNIDEKVDIVFDVAGNLSFIKCLGILKNGGRYISTLPRPKIFLHKIIQPLTKGKKVFTLLRKHSAADMATLAEWAQKGLLKPEVDSIYKLQHIMEAHRHAEQDKIKGKVIITMTNKPNE